MEVSKIAGSTVRLTCRYSNGIVKNFTARAVSLEGHNLQVACTESFEPGIGMTVMAPFLSGGQSSRITAVKRDAKGFFVVEMLLQPAPVGIRVPVKTAKPSSTAKAAFSRYATQLAEKLALQGAKSYHEAAFNRPGGQQGYVAATAAAVLLLLVEKGLVDAVAILERMRTTR